MGQAFRRAAGKLRSTTIDTTSPSSSAPCRYQNSSDRRPPVVPPEDRVHIHGKNDAGEVSAKSSPEVSEERDPTYEAMLSQMVGRITAKPGGKLEMGELLPTTKQLVQAKKLRISSPSHSLRFSYVLFISNHTEIKRLTLYSHKFLAAPLIIPANISSTAGYEPGTDENERARHHPNVEKAHRSSKRQDQHHHRAILVTGSRKQCAGEIPAKFWLPETDLPAQRWRVQKPPTSLALTSVEEKTHPLETDMRKLT
ncbi:hypothetical protein Cgig2_028309 [Carnegiea gigantea]|uniref:Uncharacterized protein n=1 Tax=Carnegiea gigantea TaxID=171969 RepID=A0A9Q1GRD5_9CARY|nr:hypothetical protein Cgig2_028309 [Carnegiea gigantea]